MKVLTRCALAFLSGIFFPIFGEIIEMPHFRDISTRITEDTLVMLDIDDTLLITSQMLGCDEWFMHRIAACQKEGMDFSGALEKTIAEWEAIRHLTKMEIVEPGTEAIIDSLQKQGFTVMGLTTQGLALATRTVQQLQEKGIDLSKTSPGNKEAYLQIGGHGVIYRKGILFTSGRHKGEAFFQLCSQLGYHPKRIVFVNDKASHIKEIESAAAQRQVPFLGLRYSYSDARKARFDSEIADYQFSHSSFKHLLSDDEARARMNGDRSIALNE
jgi:hypothetical protein